MELLSDEESEPKSILEELAEQGHDSWWDRQKVLRWTLIFGNPSISHGTDAN